MSLDERTRQTLIGICVAVVTFLIITLFLQLFNSSPQTYEEFLPEEQILNEDRSQ